MEQQKKVRQGSTVKQHSLSHNHLSFIHDAQQQAQRCSEGGKERTWRVIVCVLHALLSPALCLSCLKALKREKSSASTTGGQRECGEERKKQKVKEKEQMICSSMDWASG